MRFYYLLLFIALSLPGQTHKIVCASGCDYTNTYTGLNTALSDAAISQGRACAPYLIEIDPANPVDLNGRTITLPAKTCAQYVRIRTMRMADIPLDGTRVDTTSTALARIQSTMANAQYFVFFQGPTGSKTRYWAFEGLDIYGNSTHGEMTALLQLGEVDAKFPSSTDPGLRMDHVEVKHCWLHGAAGKHNVSNGIGVHANNVLIADNVIEDIANTGEAHGIAIGYTDGPVDVINNVIDASTINMMTGGSTLPAGLLPSFVRCIGNRYQKKGYYRVLPSDTDPTYPCRPGNVHHQRVTNQDWICSGAAPGTWTNSGTTGVYLPGAQSPKNVFEMKLGRGYRLYGNDFSGAWTPSAQAGEVFVLNLVSQMASAQAWVSPSTRPYAQPWTTITDLSISANAVHDGMAGVSFSFPQTQSGDPTFTGICAAGGYSVPPWCLVNSHNNVRIYDNLFTNMNDQRDYYEGDVVNGRQYGYVTSENTGSFDIDFQHNTYLTSTATVDSGWMNAMLINSPDGLQQGYNNVRDSIMPVSRHPTNQCNWNLGLSATASSDLRGNTLITGGPWGNNTFSTGANCVGAWPAGTQSAANNAALVDRSFKVIAPYQNTASDGRDPGANVDRVNYATAGAVSGAYNAALEYKLRGAMATRTDAAVYFTANSGNACTWELSTNPDSYASPIAVTSQTRNGRDGIATWTANLSAATVYFARATCDGLKLEHDVAGKRFMFMTAP